MDYKKIIKSIFLVLFGTLIFGAIVFATTVGTNVDVTGNMSIGGTAGFTGATTFNAAISPLTNDSAALGSASLKWSDLFLASGGVINFDNGDITLTHASNALTIAGGNYTLTQAIATSGSPTGLTFTGGAHTTLTASAEATDINFNLTRTVQFGTGALQQQRAVLIGQPTYAFVGASTLSHAWTVAIAGPPRAGTNATITNSRALAIGNGSLDNPVDTASVTMAEINMPNVAAGFGAMTNLIGLQLTSVAADIQLGNQIATLDSFIGIHLLGITLTSDTNTRTVTNATTLIVAGPPVASTNVTISNPARAVNIGGGAVTKGTAQELLVTTGAHAGMTASTEASGVAFNLSATKQWATGAMVVQREFVISAPIYEFVNASTITNAHTVDINRPPIAGPNATITTALTLGLGGVGSDVNATTASALGIFPLAIRAGYGTMTTLSGLYYTDAGLGVSLGNMNATLTNLNAIRLEAITYTAGAPIRTVTNPATLFIGGAPIASTNVVFTNLPYALHVLGGLSQIGGNLGVGGIPAAGVILTAGAPPGYAMPPNTTAARHFMTTGGIMELPNATITDIVGAYFDTFIIANGGGTETVGIVSTVYIPNAPTVGTIPTNGPYALFVDAGNSRFDGLILGAQGSDLASDNNMASPTTNYHDVTGVTQINTMATLAVTAGTVVVLQFDGTLTVKHATAGTGAQFYLAGAGDFVASAADTLTVVYDGTYWRETSRSVN